MFTTVIINDCRDPNAMGRQMARVASLFSGTVVPVGVANDLEAAGCLVDMLDAIGNWNGLILVNVAPRHGEAKKWLNGSPFCCFHYRDIIVAASLGGLTLSLAKKLGCLDFKSIYSLAPKDGNGMNSQFRSFDFLPYAAWHYLHGPIDYFDTLSGLTIPDPPKAIWYIDCFGNAKTTLLPEDINFSVGETIEINFSPLRCYRHLSNVPDGEAALTVGSSGLDEKRFLEIVVQGGSAAKRLGLKVGMEI